MAVTNTPIFTQTPRLAKAVLANANNANRDGTTGTYSASLSAGANGSLVDYLCFQASTTTVAGMLRLFYSDDSGTTWCLLDEVTVNAVTPSATVRCDQHLWLPPGGLPLPLPATGRLKFSFTGASETWAMLLAGGDF